MARYKTLAELVEAYKKLPAGQRNPLVIDNDCVVAYGPEPGYEKLLDLHPADVLEQALDLLGVPFDCV